MSQGADIPNMVISATELLFTCCANLVFIQDSQLEKSRHGRGGGGGAKIKLISFHSR